MIKIRDCILNEEKILSFDTLDEGPGVQVVMEGGHALDLFDVTLPEVEAALMGAGLLSPPDELPEPAGPYWSPEELRTLDRLREAGFTFVARQVSGRVYAYDMMPIGPSGLWTPGSEEVLGPVEVVDPLPHLTWEDGLIRLNVEGYPALSGEA